MIGAFRIGFDPALPWPWIIALGVIALAALLFYMWRGGGAPLTRALGLALIFIGLAQPQWVRERRQPADDVALILIDQSESLSLAGRAAAARRAGQEIAARLADEPGLDVRVREVRGQSEGTMLAGALEEARADIPKNRIAGAILVTDGQIADAPQDPRRFAGAGPVHALIIGDPGRGDRRLELIAAPTFGIVGEPMRVRARVADPDRNAPVTVQISIDGRAVKSVRVTANQIFDVDVTTPKRGPNMVVVEAEQGPQEISASNNRAAFSAMGVRDRLRVLLITGEPHSGARVWRNLLKSDPSVDLVHFTILRPPEKQDFTPLNELALIPFPTQELFSDRLNEFDLIIFDRYRRRDILMPIYFENIARRVEDGGALLIAAGPWDATNDSIFHTPLAAILPSQPTGHVTEERYRPTPTALGLRHPVLRGLADPAHWGPWSRQIDARASGGQTVLTGAGGMPLLVLDRAGKGRVAQLWSDQAWLWARGYQGGGPSGELLRRLSHWLMQEPELEDERLALETTAEGLAVERDTLGDAPGPVDVIAPDGSTHAVTLTNAGPGIYRGALATADQGLFEARSGALRAFAARGPLNPREAAKLEATDEFVRPMAAASGGGVVMTGEAGQHLPQIRRVDANGRAAGEDWIGLRRNGAYVVRAAASEPLGPGAAWAIAGLLLLMLGWRREAR
ncbi:MAG: hypothetical protein AB7L65_00805 [Hyphomonadaceae bacterium]